MSMWVINRFVASFGLEQQKKNTINFTLSDWKAEDLNRNEKDSQKDFFAATDFYQLCFISSAQYKLVVKVSKSINLLDTEAILFAFFLNALSERKEWVKNKV